MQHQRLYARPQLNLSFIGTNVRLEGSLLFAGKVFVEGEFKGELHGDGHLEIAEAGKVEGEIHTGELVNHGRTRGSIFVANRVELQAGCSHEGNVTARKIYIAPEAKFEGRLMMPDVIATPASKPWCCFWLSVLPPRRFLASLRIIFVTFGHASMQFGKRELVNGWTPAGRKTRNFSSKNIREDILQRRPSTKARGSSIKPPLV